MTIISLARNIADILRAIVGLDDEDRRVRILRERAAADLERDARRAKRAARRVRP